MAVLSSKAQRYLSSNRAMNKTRSRIPWRRRTKKKKIAHSQTPAEKKELQRKRKAKNEAMNSELNAMLSEVWQMAEKAHEKFGSYTVKWWYERLLQQSGKRVSTRRTSRWNAFLSKIVREENDALPAETQRNKVNHRVKDISAMWKAMSKEEQIAATDDELARLADVKETKKSSTHSVAIHSFHDARATLASVQSILEALYNRTGLEMMLIGVRTDAEAVTCPQVWTAGDRVEEFFQLACNMSVSDFAHKLENYCLTGLQGTANLCENEVAALKKKTSKLINDQYIEIARPDRVSKMLYTNFDSRITDKYGIIVEGWPLEHFVAPGTLGSRVELQTLHTAWVKGIARFRRLTPQELEDWREGKTLPAIAPSSPSTSANPPPDPQVPPLPSASTAGGEDSRQPEQPEQPTSPDQSASAIQPPPQMGVFDLGTGQPVKAKKSKPRADKGKKRGPNVRTTGKTSSTGN